MNQDRFDCISPIDYRYVNKAIAKILSENGFTLAKLEIEGALVNALKNRGISQPGAAEEIIDACAQVTTDEVYEEEGRIGHDIRALVNCLREKVSDAAKPYIHMTATSFDISDSANALRYRMAVVQELIPSLIALLHVLIEITLREADTVQIGRTHGQHAVPITFGFAIAEYVSRLGKSIVKLKGFAEELPGKFSGAVGAYNASSLFVEDPEAFEAEILQGLGIEPAEHSTQIVPPEALTRLFSEITIASVIMANLADDMRNLQRTEIGEVGEEFAADQVGSSTMPQKRNPIGFENVKSMWKIVLPRLITVFFDGISDHQRDLTNSASARTYGETIAYANYMAERLTKVMKKLRVDHANLKRNLAMQSGLVLAEPLYVLLAAQGHPDAHEKVRRLTLQAQREHRTLQDITLADPELQSYLERMTAHQREIISDPSRYTGIAAQKARKIAGHWKRELCSEY
jgi:adenylosuccinate lyase